MERKRKESASDRQTDKILKIVLTAVLVIDAVLLVVFFVSRGHSSSKHDTASASVVPSQVTAAPQQHSSSSSQNESTPASESQSSSSENDDSSEDDGSGEPFDPQGDYVGKDISVMKSAVAASEKLGQHYNLDITEEQNDYFSPGAIMKWSYSGDTISVTIAEE